jgi:alkylation response protein AidB-like acyl-CoA dehydrogenase
MGQVGRNLLPLPFMDTVVLGAKIIGTLGSEEQKREMLPAIVKGRLRLSFAHREADAGDVFDYVTTSACSDRLSGMKIHAIDGPSAAAFVVSARDVDCRLRFYLVARDQPGVECQPYRLPDNRMAMRVTLHNTPGVAIGSDASPHVAALCDLAAACLAAEAVGSIASLNRETLEYAKMRRQFGCAIGSFQVIQHRLVDMFIAEQTASAMVTDALMALDAGLPGAGPLVSAAKAQADRAGRFVGESAIQIHGGMGMTDECAVGHYLKRILTIGSQFGTAGWHVARIAENLAA